jgi:hypothetical protein
MFFLSLTRFQNHIGWFDKTFKDSGLIVLIAMIAFLLLYFGFLLWLCQHLISLRVGVLVPDYPLHASSLSFSGISDLAFVSPPIPAKVFFYSSVNQERTISICLHE